MNNLDYYMHRFIIDSGYDESRNCDMLNMALTIDLTPLKEGKPVLIPSYKWYKVVDLIHRCDIDELPSSCTIALRGGQYYGRKRVFYTIFRYAISNFSRITIGNSDYYVGKGFIITSDGVILVGVYYEESYNQHLRTVIKIDKSVYSADDSMKKGILKYVIPSILDVSSVKYINTELITNTEPQYVTKPIEPNLLVHTPEITLNSSEVTQFLTYE